jgi:hypothetical protein
VGTSLFSFAASRMTGMTGRSGYSTMSTVTGGPRGKYLLAEVEVARTSDLGTPCCRVCVCACVRLYGGGCVPVVCLAVLCVAVPVSARSVVRVSERVPASTWSTVCRGAVSLQALTTTASRW